jgi:hypothetical protein
MRESPAAQRVSVIPTLRTLTLADYNCWLYGRTDFSVKARACTLTLAQYKRQSVRHFKKKLLQGGARTPLPTPTGSLPRQRK